MTQNIQITGRVINTSTPLNDKHGANSRSLTVDNFEEGALVDVKDSEETVITIPGTFVNNSVLTLIDETLAADIVVGEFVEWLMRSGKKTQLMIS